MSEKKNKSAEWLDHEDTRLLKRELQAKLDKTYVRLRAVAGVSSDPKCAELAREIHTYLEFIDLLEDKNANKRHD